MSYELRVMSYECENSRKNAENQMFGFVTLIFCVLCGFVGNVFM